MRRLLVCLLSLMLGCRARSAASTKGADAVHHHYDREEAARLVPLLCEVLRFPTVAGNDKARTDQQAWLTATGAALGLTVRSAGLVTEIELAGPEGGPVLGLLVHGDVQPVEAAKWTIPPFDGAERDGYVLGRGAADDKGPLVQALLAMKALRESGVARTHTIRLLVGSDEESANRDIAQYLETHEPPDYSLVLDSAFPVVVGEKAWNLLTLTTPLDERKGGKAFPYGVADLEAGLASSIVPDQARIALRWKTGKPDWAPLVERLRAKKVAEGTRLEIEDGGPTLHVVVRGKSAHGGVNLEGGRNALVSLAAILEAELPAGGANDLLEAARLAGQDLYGTGFGLTEKEPLWGRYAVNVATLKPAPPKGDGGAAPEPDRVLAINLRRTPPRTGPELKTKLDTWVKELNARTGAHLAPGGFYGDEPLVFDPEAKIVKRLMAVYARAASPSPPAISGGGTYAKRMPRSIAFGMWFPGAPYPGHDVDEKVPIADLHRGAHVLIEALVDIASGPPLVEPFKP
jgi:dipeptidase D